MAERPCDLSDAEHLKHTPRSLGLRMPAEWTEHDRTWISWPERHELWKRDISAVEAAYGDLIELIRQFEPVTVVVHPDKYSIINLRFHGHYNVSVDPLLIDDSWIRDNGPTFLASETLAPSATIWKFNAWGRKYFPFDNDAHLARALCEKYNIRCYMAPLICEGGAIHSNGEDTLLTTAPVLLNKNRNPGLSKTEATEILVEFTGMPKVIWLPNGIVGDDTDGHVDNVACFVDERTVFASYALDLNDENYARLRTNIEILSKSTTAKGERLRVIEIPLPAPIMERGARLTASYLNFYFVNGGVIVPVFDNDSDERVLAIFGDVFSKREIIPFRAREICVGGGGIHCITLNQPRFGLLQGGA